ncbi:hypothetical protein HZC07_03400 [Candidatus Micrarchaeota archaeon]|nr:hypothetical protein [Candidatus Micrarchaeota archaeon]
MSDDGMVVTKEQPVETQVLGPKTDGWVRAVLQENGMDTLQTGQAMTLLKSSMQSKNSREIIKKIEGLERDSPQRDSYAFLLRVYDHLKDRKPGQEIDGDISRAILNLGSAPKRVAEQIEQKPPEGTTREEGKPERGGGEAKKPEEKPKEKDELRITTKDGKSYIIEFENKATLEQGQALLGEGYSVAAIALNYGGKGVKVRAEGEKKIYTYDNVQELAKVKNIEESTMVWKGSAVPTQIAATVKDSNGVEETYLLTLIKPPNAIRLDGLEDLDEFITKYGLQGEKIYRVEKLSGKKTEIDSDKEELSGKVTYVADFSEREAETKRYVITLGKGKEVLAIRAE